MKRHNYLYIDESGDLVLDSKSKVFILGCIITDSPEKIKESFSTLMFDLDNNMYFKRYKSQIMKEGFHACANHPDIYAHFVKFIHPLNFRCYFVVINKSTDFFRNLVANKTSNEIYNDCIKKLLGDRILRRKDNFNHLIFEQNLDNPSPKRILNREEEIKEIIEGLNKHYIDKGFIKENIEFSIKLATKEEPILSITDYVSHIVSKICEGREGKIDNYMKENFQLIEPKIGLIYLYHTNEHIKIRNNTLNIQDLFIK